MNAERPPQCFVGRLRNGSLRSPQLHRPTKRPRFAVSEP